MKSQTDTTFTKELKRAMIDRDFTQRLLVRRLRAKGIDIDEPRLSKIIHRKAPTTPQEREQIALLLKRDTGDLFPEVSA